MNRMPDLPLKRKPAARKRTSTRASTAKTAARPKKKLPPMRTPGEQPRDSNGRWVKVGKAVLSGAGKVVKGAAYGTAAIVGGSAAVAHATYKTVMKPKRRRTSGRKSTRTKKGRKR